MVSTIIGLFGGLKEVIHVKHLDQRLTLYVSCYYYEIIVLSFSNFSQLNCFETTIIKIH